MRTLIITLLLTSALHAETRVKEFDSTITLVTTQTFTPKVFTMSQCILYYETEGLNADDAAKLCKTFKGDIQ